MPVIQCGVFKGINRAHFVDRREFEGTIQEQKEAAYQYVLEKINLAKSIITHRKAQPAKLDELGKARFVVPSYSF